MLKSKKNITNIILAGTAIVGTYIAYLTLIKPGQDGSQSGSLGGTDSSLLGDQGFNVDPNSPLYSYIGDLQAQNDKMANLLANPPEQPVPTETQPSDTTQPDQTSPAGTTAASAAAPSGTADGVVKGNSYDDLVSNLIMGAAFAGGALAVDVGYKKLFGAKDKITDPATAKEELKGKTDEVKVKEEFKTDEVKLREEKLKFDKINPEAQFKPDAKVGIKDAEFKVSTEPVEARVKFTEKIPGLKTAGKVVGEAGTILVAAQLGGEVIGQANRAFDITAPINQKVTQLTGNRVAGAAAQFVPYLGTSVGLGTYEFGKGVVKFTGGLFTGESEKDIWNSYKEKGFFGGTADVLGISNIKQQVVGGISQAYSTPAVAATNQVSKSSSSSGNSSSKLTTSQQFDLVTGNAQLNAAGLPSVNVNTLANSAKTTTATVSTPAKSSGSSGGGSSKSGVGIATSSTGQTATFKTGTSTFGNSGNVGLIVVKSTPAKVGNQPAKVTTAPKVTVSAPSTKKKK